jgi:hypothetical protein
VFGAGFAFVGQQCHNEAQNGLNLLLIISELTEVEMGRSADFEFMIGLCVMLVALLLTSGLAPAMSKESESEHLSSLQRPATPRQRMRTLLVPDADRVLYLIGPQETDPRITEELQDHFVIYYKHVPANGKLLVFLPGTDAMPRYYQSILDTGAQLGYKVIGLEYQNIGNPTELSESSQDPEAQAKVRLARLTGQNVSPFVHMTPGNSIEERLLSLLSFLDRAHPTENWSAFYSGDKIHWPLVCVAGHSQGAGMAAFIAKREPVLRAALLSGPGDLSRQTKGFVPSWLYEPGKTPSERIFAAYHITEQQRRPGFFQRRFDAMGIGKFGLPVRAEEVAPPYAHSHIIQMTLTPAVSDAEASKYGAAHGSVACDRPTPKLSNGQPAYGPVWRYLFGADPQ